MYKLKLKFKTNIKNERNKNKFSKINFTKSFKTKIKIKKFNCLNYMSFYYVSRYLILTED